MAERIPTDQKVEAKAPTGYVTVACKIHVAWIDLHVDQEIEEWENTPVGGRKIKKFVPVGDPVRIRGTAYPVGVIPEGFPDRPQMVMGYALTPNVPREFWDNWLKQNKLAPFVKSNMIIAFESVADIKAKASDHEKDLSGIEPLIRGYDRENRADVIVDPRVPRGLNANRAA